MRWLAALMALACVPAASVVATPIVYDLTFDTGAPDIHGTGMFIWHDDTATISTFMWDFGEGRVGGYFDGGWGQELFNLLTLQVDPASPCYQSGECVRMRAGTGFGWPWSPDSYFEEFSYNPVLRVAQFSILDYTDPDFPLVIGGTITATRRNVSVPDLLQQLLTDSTAVGPGESLADKVALAQTYYAVPDIQSACAVLQSYLLQVTALKGKKLSDAQAEALSADAEAIMSAIACEKPNPGRRGY